MQKLAVCALVIAFGCNKHEEQAKPAAPAPAAPAPAPAPVVADAAPKLDYDGHMKAGAALEDQKKWSEALGEFEAAAAAKPDDARALGEVGFTAHFAGKDDRAKEASLAAVAAAKDDKKLRGSALFNLGLAVEKTMPHAAAALYAASNEARPNAAVRARFEKVQGAKPTPEGDALLAKVGVKAAPASLPSRTDGKPIDMQLMAALGKAGVEWQGAAGKSVLFVENVECRENHQVKPTTYECTQPPVKGAVAKALIDNLVARKIAPTKEHGDMVTYKVATVNCRSFDEGEAAIPDACDVTP